MCIRDSFQTGLCSSQHSLLASSTSHQGSKNVFNKMRLSKNHQSRNAPVQHWHPCGIKIPYNLRTLNRLFRLQLEPGHATGSWSLWRLVCHLSPSLNALKSVSIASMRLKWHIYAKPLIAVSTPRPTKRQRVSLNRRFAFNAVSLTSTDPNQKPHRGFFF